jgi:hypothetical protein
LLNWELRLHPHLGGALAAAAEPEREEEQQHGDEDEEDQRERDSDSHRRQAHAKGAADGRRRTGWEWGLRGGGGRQRRRGWERRRRGLKYHERNHPGGHEAAGGRSAGLVVRAFGPAQHVPCFSTGCDVEVEGHAQVRVEDAAVLGSQRGGAGGFARVAGRPFEKVAGAGGGGLSQPAPPPGRA